jgi:hypothetical protein
MIDPFGSRIIGFHERVFEILPCPFIIEMSASRVVRGVEFQRFASLRHGRDSQSIKDISAIILEMGVQVHASAAINRGDRVNENLSIGFEKKKKREPRTSRTGSQNKAKSSRAAPDHRFASPTASFVPFVRCVVKT